VVEVDHPNAGKTILPGNPVKLGDSEDVMERPAPLLSEHTQEVLSALGYSPEKIEDLKQKKII